MQNFKGKYFGQDKIKKATIVEGSTTYLGKPRIKLIFRSGKSEMMPLEVANSAVTDSSLDATQMTDKKIRPVVEKLLAILTEAELTMSEMNYLIPKLKRSIEVAVQLADEVYWGKERYKITLKDIDGVLKSQSPEEQKEMKEKINR